MDIPNQTSSRHNSNDSSSDITSGTSGLDTDPSDDHSSEEGQTGFSYLRLSRRHKCIIISICSTSFVLMMSESVMVPIYPEETVKRGVSMTMSGWVFASYAFGQMIFSPIAGKYLGRVGTRFVFLAGVFFTGGSTILFGFVGDLPITGDRTVFVVYCFVMQISLALGVTATETASFSMAAKAFGSNFTTVFGLIEVFVGLGMTVGPAVGGVLYTFGGFRLPFIVVGCLVLLCLPFNYLLIPPDENVVEEKGGKSTSVILSVLKDPTAVVTLLSVVMGAAMFAVLDPILEPRLVEFGLTPEITGAMFLILSASYALFAPVSSWLSDKLPDNRIVMVQGFFLCCISHLLLGNSPVLGFSPDYKEVWLTILSLVLLGGALSLVIIPSYQIILDVAIVSGLEDSIATHGAVAGLFCTMYAAGDFLGPVYGGWMAESSGFSWTLTYTGLVSILTVILLIVSAVYDMKCRKPRTSNIVNEKTSLLDSSTNGKHEYLSFTDVYKTPLSTGTMTQMA